MDGLQGPTLAKLVILQAIYASADGFRDADGNAVVPLLLRNEGLPPGVTVANMEVYGYPNPLIAGADDRWQNARNVEGAFQTHASVEEDATSGRRDIVTTGGYPNQEGHAAERVCRGRDSRVERA